MPNSIVIAETAHTELAQAPIPADWILSGAPAATSKLMAASNDGSSCVMVWECTPGRFRWHYREDETLVVQSGEAFIEDDAGEERRIGPGDMVFFPAGTSSTWTVTVPIRKVAVIRKTLPLPLGFGLRVWNKLLRVVQTLRAMEERTSPVAARQPSPADGIGVGQSPALESFPAKG